MKATLLLAAAVIAWRVGPAQVGVNQPNPTQTLDVNGKLKVGDDAAAPTAGTIRYNGADATFEGHTGAGWETFNEATHAGLPSAAVPVFGRYNALSPGETGVVTFYEPVAGSIFSSVPAGKTLIVHTAFVEPNFFTFTSLRYAVFVGPSTSSTSYTGISSIASFRLTGDAAESNYLTSPTAPLSFVPPGAYLYVQGAAANEGAVEVYFRGFLVDDLTY